MASGGIFKMGYSIECTEGDCNIRATVIDIISEPFKANGFIFENPFVGEGEKGKFIHVTCKKVGHITKGKELRKAKIRKLIEDEIITQEESRTLNLDIIPDSSTHYYHRCQFSNWTNRIYSTWGIKHQIINPYKPAMLYIPLTIQDGVELGKRIGLFLENYNHATNENIKTYFALKRTDVRVDKCLIFPYVVFSSQKCIEEFIVMFNTWERTVIANEKDRFGLSSDDYVRANVRDIKFAEDLWFTQHDQLITTVHNTIYFLNSDMLAVQERKETCEPQIEIVYRYPTVAKKEVKKTPSEIRMEVEKIQHDKKVCTFYAQVSGRSCRKNGVPEIGIRYALQLGKEENILSIYKNEDLLSQLGDLLSKIKKKYFYKFFLDIIASILRGGLTIEIVCQFCQVTDSEWKLVAEIPQVEELIPCSQAINILTNNLGFVVKDYRDPNEFPLLKENSPWITAVLSHDFDFLDDAVPKLKKVAAYTHYTNRAPGNVENHKYRDGLVFITGPLGSGKTTDTIQFSNWYMKKYNPSGCTTYPRVATAIEGAAKFELAGKHEVKCVQCHSKSLRAEDDELGVPGEMNHVVINSFKKIKKSIEFLVIEEAVTTFESLATIEEGNIYRQRWYNPLAKKLSETMAHTRFTIVSDALITTDLLETVNDIRQKVIDPFKLGEADNLLKLNGKGGTCTVGEMAKFSTTKIRAAKRKAKAISGEFYRCGVTRFDEETGGVTEATFRERCIPVLIYKRPKNKQLMYDIIKTWDWVPLRNYLVQNVLEGKSAVVYCSTTIVAENLYVRLLSAFKEESDKGTKLLALWPNISVLTRKSLAKLMERDQIDINGVVDMLMDENKGPSVIITTTCLGAGMSITGRGFDEAYLFAEFGFNCPGLTDIVQLSGRVRCIKSKVINIAVSIKKNTAAIMDRARKFHEFKKYADDATKKIYGEEIKRQNEMRQIFTNHTYALYRLSIQVRDAAAIILNKEEIKRPNIVRVHTDICDENKYNATYKAFKHRIIKTKEVAIYLLNLFMAGEKLLKTFEDIPERIRHHLWITKFGVTSCPNDSTLKIFHEKDNSFYFYRVIGQCHEKKYVLLNSDQYWETVSKAHITSGARNKKRYLLTIKELTQNEALVIKLINDSCGLTQDIERGFISFLPKFPIPLSPEAYLIYACPPVRSHLWKNRPEKIETRGFLPFKWFDAKKELKQIDRDRKNVNLYHKTVQQTTSGDTALEEGWDAVEAQYCAESLEEHDREEDKWVCNTKLPFHLIEFYRHCKIVGVGVNYISELQRLLTTGAKPYKKRKSSQTTLELHSDSNHDFKRVNKCAIQNS
ncbi:hypothetical protein HOLleu_43318 [Holothuria leucospilota]|uniref:Uncharacterized protein n=1 Tax=Holothuria leucospilota TaxID=206669 RepID=A0A9Q0YBX6_HOLLE|nr:hypothetical protein HOLleu_43318 [Holothuria leucospilota]